MKILIDGTTLCDKFGGAGAGVEHYSFAIIAAMIRQKSSHHFFLYIPKQLTTQRLHILIGDAKNVTILKSFGSSIPFFSRHLFLPLRFGFARPDVLFSPFGQTPLLWRGKSVITIHDCAIYEHPEWFAPLGNQNFSTQVVVPNSIKRSKAIIAVSEFTKSSLTRLFPEVHEKTTVVYEGVEPPETTSRDYALTRFPFDRDFVLALGTIEPRKNLSLAFEAFHLFLEQRPELARTVRLIVAGKSGWGCEETVRVAEKVNHAWADIEPGGVIRFLGTVTEEEKWTLLQRASVFVFPSLHEGFGLPVLEAMSVGIPVVTTGSGAVAEVGGDVVIRVNLGDPAAMSLALAQCLLVPEGASVLHDEGIKRAKLFSWQKAAKETLEVIENIV